MIKTQNTNQEFHANGSRVVLIHTQDGKHSCRLYVNARDGIASASATAVAKSFRRIEAAREWAREQVAA